MSRLSDIASSPMLKEYAQGASQSAMGKTADFLAPTVAVAQPVGRFKVYNEKNKFRLPDTKRAIGGRAAEVTWTASDSTYNCQPNSIDCPVDIMESMAQQDLENAMKDGANMAAEIGALAHEKNVIDAAVAGATTGATTPSWIDTADPIKDIDAAILAVLKAAKYGSLMGVGVLLGATVMYRLKNHPLVRNRFIVGGTNTRGPSVAPLAAIDENTIGSLLIGNPETKVTFAVYDSAAEGVAESINFVLDTSMLVFARSASPTRRDPSFMKTFRLAGQFMVPGVYMRDDQRVEVAKFDWSEDIKVTNATAARLITPTWS